MNLEALLSRFNELARDTYEMDFHVLVIDDGSSDDTAGVAISAAGSLPVEVLRNAKNLGLAETFMRGMMEAVHKAGPRDVIVCMDADNSHVPGPILRMIREIQEGRDVVIASRYQPGSVVRGVTGLLMRLPCVQCRVPQGCSRRRGRGALRERRICLHGQDSSPSREIGCHHRRGPPRASLRSEARRVQDERVEDRRPDAPRACPRALLRPVAQRAP